MRRNRTTNPSDLFYIVAVIVLGIVLLNYIADDWGAIPVQQELILEQQELERKLKDIRDKARAALEREGRR